MMLEVRDLHAYYGKSHILQGVDLSVDQGEIVSLLGRNGVGRSTACKTIMGLLPPVGNVAFKGRPIAGLRPDQIAHLGIGYVPEDRQVFPGLTVKQNLELGMKRAGVEGRSRSGGRKRYGDRDPGRLSSGRCRRTTTLPTAAWLRPSSWP